MMTTTAYLVAWGAYLVAAAGLFAVLFRITRGWRPVAFRVVLRAVGLLWLVMPAVVEPGAVRETLAPALALLMLELATGGYTAAARVLEPMLLLTVAIIPLALGLDWGFNRWRAQRAAAPTAAAADRAVAGDDLDGTA